MSGSSAHFCDSCGAEIAPFGFYAGSGGGFAGYVWACRAHRDELAGKRTSPPPRPARYDADGQGVLL